MLQKTFKQRQKNAEMAFVAPAASIRFALNLFEWCSFDAFCMASIALPRPSDSLISMSKSS